MTAGVDGANARWFFDGVLHARDSSWHAKHLRGHLQGVPLTDLADDRVGAVLGAAFHRAVLLTFREGLPGGLRLNPRIGKYLRQAGVEDRKARDVAAGDTAVDDDTLGRLHVYTGDVLPCPDVFAEVLALAGQAAQCPVTTPGYPQKQLASRVEKLQQVGPPVTNTPWDRLAETAVADRLTTAARHAVHEAIPDASVDSIDWAVGFQSTERQQGSCWGELLLAEDGGAASLIVAVTPDWQVDTEPGRAHLMHTDNPDGVPHPYALLDNRFVVHVHQREASGRPTGIRAARLVPIPDPYDGATDWVFVPDDAIVRWNGDTPKVTWENSDAAAVARQRFPEG